MWIWVNNERSSEWFMNVIWIEGRVILSDSHMRTIQCVEGQLSKYKRVSHLEQWFGKLVILFDFDDFSLMCCDIIICYWGSGCPSLVSRMRYLYSLINFLAFRFVIVFKWKNSHTWTLNFREPNRQTPFDAVNCQWQKLLWEIGGHKFYSINCN